MPLLPDLQSMSLSFLDGFSLWFYIKYYFVTFHRFLHACMCAGECGGQRWTFCLETRSLTDWNSLVGLGYLASSPWDTPAVTSPTLGSQTVIAMHTQPCYPGSGGLTPGP